MRPLWTLLHAGTLQYIIVEVWRSQLLQFDLVDVDKAGTHPTVVHLRLSKWSELEAGMSVCSAGRHCGAA